MATMAEVWSRTGTALASFMFVWAVIKQFFPYQLQGHFERYVQKLIALFYPYIQITFHEHTGEYMKRSEAYSAIQNYLMTNSSAVAKRLKADVVKNSKSLVLSMDDYEEVTDEFKGVQVWWQSNKKTTENKSISFYPASDDRRFYKLTFHRRDRKLITDFYLEHVLSEGKLISVRNRQRKLLSNVPSQNWYGWKANKWSHVPFEHPATFDTLAMPSKKKEDIKKDLIKFSQSKDYYKKIGKPWKRGYLLYGPPGTGKSTMIAAIANFLDYDVYDLELTAVKDNTELRRLLIETSSKSIIVIEDIDCSLDLTGQRSKKKEEKKEDGDGKDPIEKKLEKEAKSNQDSKVTLSGLLNFIDGLWSACGSERIIVFTTNFIDKLDPALIRRGRMDKRIEMSYCCFEAFEFLARNYLDIESHELFADIKTLLEETNITPADVAENLMPKSEDDDPETCLKELIEALKTAKEEAAKKAEEEKKAAEEEERKKAQEEEEKKKKKKETEENKKDGEKSEAKENGEKTDAKENGEIRIEKGVKE